MIIIAPKISLFIKLIIAKITNININLSLNEFTRKYIGPLFLFSTTIFNPFSKSLLFASFVLNPLESVFKIL